MVVLDGVATIRTGRKGSDYDDGGGSHERQSNLSPSSLQRSNKVNCDTGTSVDNLTLSRDKS